MRSKDAPGRLAAQIGSGHPLSVKGQPAWRWPPVVEKARRGSRLRRFARAQCQPHEAR